MTLFDGWTDVLDSIHRARGMTHGPVKFVRASPVSGGSINSAYRLNCVLNDNEHSFFVKINRVEYTDMFAAEAEGLIELARAGAIRVPDVIACGMNDTHAWLVSEYIVFSGMEANSERSLGEQLARLHRYTSDCFGWHRDNTIGSTPQPNRQMDDWVAFWREYRLGYQFKLLAGRDSHVSGMEALLEALPVFFSSHQLVPSLLHGDLWGGNRGFDTTGEPVIFDPAVYYGDREADIAMTELFGGFGAGFYEAYRAAWPLDDGYAVRKDLYNLYHILNHANLFGGAYLHQAEIMIARLLAEVR